VNLTDFVQFLKIESETKKERKKYDTKQNEKLGSVGQFGRAGLPGADQGVWYSN